MHPLTILSTPSPIAKTDNVTLRWAWLVLIGILIIGAGIAWIHCRNAGYAGFGGHIEAVRNGWGITIGIKLACY